jgi:deferrochelatase/peroxidase EfeB
MEGPDIAFDDIQGLVRFAHGHLKGASFFLLSVKNPDRARAWLAKALKNKSITTAVEGKLPRSALQVAFTCKGLRALGISPEILDQFSAEFRDGMAEPSRSRRLGDVGHNRPARWLWGTGRKAPDMLVLLYADPSALANRESELRREFAAAGLAVLHCLTTHDIGDVEPFGFADGISQPALDWDRTKPTRLTDTNAYTNLSALGEFLLGYPNEYGLYTERPLVEARDDPHNLLPLGEQAAGRKDFGRNGTFLVVRDLSQDVRGFWRFLDEQAKHDPREAKKLAETMTGRTMAGDPLVRMHPRSIEGVGPGMKEILQNRFTYDNDPEGTACPFGAHIRRANPRNADLPPGTRGFFRWAIRMLGFGRKGPRDDAVASTRFHRLLRRGREHGTKLEREDVYKPAKGNEERGLRFLCLNANISRQFEFVQTAWLASSKFDGLSGESDPLVGNRLPLFAGTRTDAFSIPQDSGLQRRITGLPAFVTVRGGGYFFLPGVGALKYIASGNAGGK